MASPHVQRHRAFKYRVALLISIVVIVPLGYAVRFHGLAPEWLNDSFGSIAYEIFWILLVALLFPQASPLWTAVGVCLATCALEFLQLATPIVAGDASNLTGSPRTGEHLYRVRFSFLLDW